MKVLLWQETSFSRSIAGVLWRHKQLLERMEGCSRHQTEGLHFHHPHIPRSWTRTRDRPHFHMTPVSQDIPNIGWHRKRTGNSHCKTNGSCCYSSEVLGCFTDKKNGWWVLYWFYYCLEDVGKMVGTKVTEQMIRLYAESWSWVLGEAAWESKS